ncbi:MAG: symmetrical bis(5'-nucleosyl)-tetraphosphatase [Pseudomonadota bacterium]|nr:symmetrical bis(5'-nucleosyl)-tetraphosphatase [Pseudomonadota bacterium]
MADYVLGDIHANPNAIKAMCDLIQFNKHHDHLFFIGDLVNSGPDSWGVLDLIYHHYMDQVTLILGNHDISFMAKQEGKSLSPHQRLLLSVLTSGKLAHHHKASDSLLVHAGIWPSWTLNTTLNLAHEATLDIQAAFKRQDLSKHLYSDIHIWSDRLRGWQRTTAIINIMTRMRVVDQISGALNLSYKGGILKQPDGCCAWFDRIQTPPTKQVIFGHWSLLEQKNHPSFICIDHSYTYGGKLMALRLDDNQAFFLDAGF